MKRLGVLGWPVAHSRSPAIQRAAFAALGLDGWSYQRLPVPPELFDETVRALPAAGFVGANVTIPHKAAALALADTATAAATEIGAANTLSFGEDGAIAAANTDAPGLLAALPGPVAGRRALVLGAGGSARAVVWALRGAGAEVAVWNRTPARAVELAEAFGVRAVGAVGAAEPADLLVQCTSVGLSAASLQGLPIDAEAVGTYPWVVDLAYGDHGPTAVVAAATAAGCEVSDGLDVLVAQGALSFERWTGEPAPRDAMRAAARAG